MKRSRWLDSFRSEPGIYLLPWLVLTPLSAIGTGAFIPEINNGYSNLWLLVGLVAHLATGLILLLGRMLIAKFSGNSRVLIGLATFALAGVARGTTVSYLAFSLGLISQTETVWRMVSGSFLVFGLIGVANILIYETQSHQTRRAELNAKLGEEKALLSKIREVLFNERKQTLDETLKLVQLGLTQVESATKDRQSVQRVAQALHEMVDQGLGPLIKKLKREESTEFDEVVLPKTRISGAERFRRAFVEQPFRPLLAITLSTLLTFSSKLWVYGAPLAIIDFFANCAAILISYYLGGKLLKKIRSTPVAAVSNLFFLALPAVTAASLPLVLFPQDSLPILTSVSLFSNTLVAGMAAAIGAASAELADQVIMDLKSAVERLALGRSRYQQLRLTERRKLSRLLHGSVQSRLRSLAMEIERTGLAPSKSKLQDLRMKIEMEIFQQEMANMDSLLGDLKELWENSATINYEIDDDTATVLDSDINTQLAVTEVIREITANAMKHSKSEYVNFSIRLPSNWRSSSMGNISLIARFDGVKVEIASHGNGIQVIEELTSSYRYFYEDGSNMFWCEIPVQFANSATTGT